MSENVTRFAEVVAKINGPVGDMSNIAMLIYVAPELVKVLKAAMTVRAEFDNAPATEAEQRMSDAIDDAVNAIGLVLEGKA